MSMTSRAWAGSLAVLAFLLGCYNSDDHSPTAPDFQAALSLTPLKSSIPADGISRVELTAQIDPAAAADRRTITFKTSDGTLMGAGTSSDNGKQMVLDADSKGQAKVQLQSSTTIHTVEVSASVSNAPGLVQRVQVDFVSVTASDVLSVGASSSTAPADGATLTRVFADISPNLPTGQRTVTFKTNFGTFASSGQKTETATADASNRASVDLKSDLQAGDARITASIAGSSVETTVKFTTALPESLLVLPAKLTIHATPTDDTLVTVKLLRPVGVPSLGTAVVFKVVKAGTTDDLHFLVRNQTTSNDKGEVTANISAPNDAFKGTATIIATVGNVSGEANIEVVP